MVSSPAGLTLADCRCMSRDEEVDGCPLLRCGRLFHQFGVDMYARMESSRLRYYRYNQEEVNAAAYQGLQDAVDRDLRPEDAAMRIVLPSSFVGGPRHQHMQYQDAMALVRTLGKPDLFITFTANPGWVEIRRELLPGQTAADRPDLVVRVFHQRFKSFVDDIVHRGLLGRCVAAVNVIEFQKRGLPHAHMLVILGDECKPRTPEEIDLLVTAELPDSAEEQTLFERVEAHMIHVCAPRCLKNGKCIYGYPKNFRSSTTETEGTYPLYRRRNNGTIALFRGKAWDNRYVVPYNRRLLLKYDAHFNVEICTNVHIVKYLYKGSDYATVEVASRTSAEEHAQPPGAASDAAAPPRAAVDAAPPPRGAVDAAAPPPGAVDAGRAKSKVIDEIKHFVNNRYLSAHESLWRILGFELHGVICPGGRT